MKRILPGVGYDIYETADGVSLVMAAPDALETADHPFKVKLKGLKYTVVPGTVNNMMPTLGGTALDTLPSPEGTLSSTCHIYLKCQHTAGSDFPVTVTVEQGSTVPASDESYLYVTIASIDVTSGKAKKTAQPIETSLSAEYFKCGSEDPVYFTSRT